MTSALARLAEHPAAPPVLLRALASGVQRSDTELFLAVVAHRATPHDVVDDLLANLVEGLPRGLAQDEEVLVRAAAREVVPDTALAALTWAGASPSLAVMAVSAAGPDHLPGLVSLCVNEPDVRTVVVPGLIDCAAMTAELAARLARALLADPQPLPEVRSWIVSLLERHPLPGLPAAARDMAGVAPSDALRQDLLDVANRARERNLLAQLAVESATRLNTEEAWLAAINDPHHGLVAAAAAIEAFPSEDVLTHIVAHMPAPIAREAYLVLRAMPYARVGSIHQGAAALAPGAPTSFLAALTRSSKRGTDIPDIAHAALADPALPSDALSRVAAWPTSSTGGPSIGLALAFHPNTPRAARAAAMAHLTEERPWLRALEPAVHALLAGDRSGAGALLPADALQDRRSGPRWAYEAHTSDLADDVLAEHLPQLTPEAAAALVHLAPGFTGTLGELLSTAQTIGS